MILINIGLTNQKADRLFTEHINTKILSIFEKLLKSMGYDDPRDIFPKDEFFCEQVRRYLPKSYPFLQIGETFLNTFYTVKAESFCADPDVITEYVIHSVLTQEIEELENLHNTLTEPIPEVDEFLEEFSEVVVSSEEDAKKLDQNMKEIRELIYYCEDMKNYPDLCSSGRNLEYLDVLTEKGLKKLIKEKYKEGEVVLKEYHD